MNIYTSYFGNLRKLWQAGIVPVSIARWDPKWFEGVGYKIVAPPADILRNDITRERYIQQYEDRVLKRLNSAVIIRDLEIYSGGKDCALLCYEKPGDFCHRRLLADWILKDTGLLIPEFGYIEKLKDPEIQELTLF